MISEKTKKIIIYVIVLSFFLPIIGTILFEIFNLDL